MPILVFIESNTTGTGELFIKAAIQRGLTPYFLTTDRNKYRFLDRLRVVAISIDTSDTDKVSDFVSSLDDVAGVFSSSEYFTEIASEVAARVGLRTANTEAIKICRDKKRLAEVLEKHGIGVPRTFDLPLWDLEKFDLESLTYPVVVKPRTGSGSVNVKLDANARDVQEHCEAMRMEGLVSALMQEYVQGEEYSVETLTLHGRTQVTAVIKKHLGPEPHFVEIGHSFPAGLSRAQRHRVEATVVAALSAVGFAFGPAHTELRLSNDSVTIIEINPRLAGGMIPVLLKEVLDFDVIDHILGIWTMELGLPDIGAKRYGAIRFAVPRREGVLRSPIHLPRAAGEIPELKCFHVLREPGEHVGLAKDYRDRVAVIICAGDQQDAVEASAEWAAASVVIDLEEAAAAMSPAAPKRGLPEHLQEIVYRSEGGTIKPCSELGYLIDINEAHLIMLGETRLVARDKVNQLLAVHRTLRTSGSRALSDGPRPRGLYMLVEQYLIDTLGEEVGGVMQTGRSRNDINATTTKLILRDATSRVFEALWDLRRSLIFKASSEVGKPFPIYSQYQPALPGTLTHQLLAFEQALASECRVMLDSNADLDVCPLGAGAGGGTTLPIDPELVCKLLGFKRPAANSLDAVANRNHVVHFLSAMNAIALLLSRLAQDLQLWSTTEFALIAFPEELCGGSSMLPQKRNPFLVEFMKSRSSIPLGSLSSCSAVISKTPFANSFEIGSQINRFIADSEQAVLDVLTVAKALVDAMEVEVERVDQHLKHTAVASLAVSESMVMRQGVSFRSAHTQVAQSMRAKLAGGESTYQALLEMEEGFIARSPFEWALSHAWGGGPGSAGLKHGIAQACKGLAEDAAAFGRKQAVWQEAQQLRELACEQLING
ncbi:MAG: ATP-grasp domain-containing protein [Alcaligenaceae bacterium]|nr:MAG: ATP-grasp domain-containing protein [Alcaligenaceae bacterium]